MRKKAIDPVDNRVGERIRMRRLELGWSQSELAEHLGVTFQQVQKYEKGSNRVSASKLQLTATVLGVQPAHFFDEGPNTVVGVALNEAPNFIKQFLLLPEGVALAASFMQIKNMQLRRCIVRLAETLAVYQE